MQEELWEFREILAQIDGQIAQLQQCARITDGQINPESKENNGKAGGKEGGQEKEESNAGGPEANCRSREAALG